MSQKIEVVYCPSCGAPVKFLEGREDTFCTSCGHQLFREDTHLEMKLKHEEVKMEYEDRKDRRRHKEREDERLKKNNTIALIVGTILTMFMFILLYIMCFH